MCFRCMLLCMMHAPTWMWQCPCWHVDSLSTCTTVREGPHREVRSTLETTYSKLIIGTTTFKSNVLKHKSQNMICFKRVRLTMRYWILKEASIRNNLSNKLKVLILWTRLRWLCSPIRGCFAQHFEFKCCCFQYFLF